jgi:hypothetical protein
VRISFSWRSVARRLMRRVRIVLAWELDIVFSPYHSVRTVYVTWSWAVKPRWAVK